MEGMTVKQLIAKLQWAIENDFLKEEDYVFYALPDEDEGNVANLRPVSNIEVTSFLMFRNEGETIEGMLQKQPINLCFMKPKYWNEK